MTACHDPYRELELYLEKAREEIGRAIKELEEHEDETPDYNDNLLPPPQAFRTQNWTTKPNAEVPRISASSLNHFCHDGNLLDLGYSSSKSSICGKPYSSPTSFVSSFGKNGKMRYSPNTRRRLWCMHPSISFPETSKDLLLLRNDASSNGFQDDHRTRQRSNSDTTTRYNVPEEHSPFPRPPSGDVNLLSIWADNLVLELNKSLSGELLVSSSPSSDYSLSPVKQDDGSLKEVSRSPDSGIEQASCNTPDMPSKQKKDLLLDPPSQFDATLIKDRSQGTQTAKCFSRSCVKSAEVVSVGDEVFPILLNEDLPIVNEVEECWKQPLNVEYLMSKVVPNGFDTWASLPRNSATNYSTSSPQRCASQPAVSTINYVSIDELAAFMRKVKINSYHPPSCADVSTDVKDDKENKDAVTQTTPIPLSRSSSFTWVTECEWNGGSDEMSSKVDYEFSSDADECCPGSGSSSLYLSACSGSSDSFEEALPFCSSETTLRASTLEDISETLSIESPIQESASFPSTLRMSRKSPARPIEPTVNELNLKSVSAPVLLRQKFPKAPESSSSDSSPSTGSKDPLNEKAPARSHSAKELNELQAIEACSWLRAAGFPQYAQMYEDNQFPIDICMVQKDHAFLHPDSIQSLFRRLNTLNRCAKMKFMDHVHRKSLHLEDSDDEEQYALSENWEFQRSSRRWSRIPSPSTDVGEYIPQTTPKPPGQLLTTPGRKYLSPEEAYCSSHDSVFIDDPHSSPDSIRRSTVQKIERVSSGLIGDCSPGSSSGSGGTLSLASEDAQERRTLRRSGSDRVKEGAKALLRRMESLKGKRKKKSLDVSKSEKLNLAPDGSSSSSLTSSPQFPRQKVLPSEMHNKDGDDTSIHSDSEWRLFLVSNQLKDANRNNRKHNKYYNSAQTSVTITSPGDELPFIPKEVTDDQQGYLKPEFQKKNLLHPDSTSNQVKEDSNKRGSYYDNVYAPLVVFNDVFTESSSPSKPTSKTGGGDQESLQNQEDGDIIILNTERRDSGVGSSLTRGISCQQTPWHCFYLPVSSNVKPFPNPAQITDLTAPQILLLRKLSLLKLTTVMEKFSPSSRTGLNWGLSKFIGRIRNHDYKDKVVFGVPLLLILQRTGQPLPISIQTAIHYLRKTALDSTGLFRKSGVRSRIQKLKTLNDASPEKISYEEHQAYDVADMLKQYFRELPEALLTNKLSETFLSIFQHVPEDSRLEAIQAALMLMPDENREVLQFLLEFLHEVCQHSGINQMTATNLAVCFAPSLFHLSTPRSASSSPRRRKTVGAPDLRELNENRAAYECLSCMIANYKTLFTVSEEVISQSRISSSSNFQPATLEDLSSFTCNGQSGWKGFIDNCIQVLLKEAKEKYKGWKTISQSDNIDLSYKKLSDDHPLKLWKVSTEAEAPPVDILNRILRERHVWDNSFTKWKVVSRLNKHSEIYQYLNTCLPPHPPSDYCILRSWRTDLPKGTCVLIESSIEHREAEIMTGSVRALVLASQYLIEPCGSGKSRITYISRVDTRGRSPEWYNRAYGHICTLFLNKLRNSFSRTRADGPETKV